MSEQQRLSPGRVGPCPFCGNPLTQKRGKVNPYARCETEDCFGSRCPVVNLDDPRSVAAWNARAIDLAQAERMVSLSASEVACYRWPEDTTEHRAMRAAFCDGAALSAVTPSPAGEAERAAIIDRITNITTWLREPDWIEEASLEWLMDWMDRRPIAELAMVAMLMPGPVVSSTDRQPCPLKEATMAQHFDTPKGEPARFVRNGILETCQCRGCAAMSPATREDGA